MTDDIVAFLRARLAEDARDFEVSIEHCPPAEIYKADGTVALVPHGIAWYRRMLRGVKAKRCVAELMVTVIEGFDRRRSAGATKEHPSVRFNADYVLLQLASEWSGHLDYQAEWGTVTDDETAPTDDDVQNNLVATGALFAVLHMVAVPGAGLTSVALPEHGPANQITVTFAFMKSPYRVTVERVRDETTGQ